MNANVEVRYEASSMPIISKNITDDNKEKIATRFLNEITSLKQDLDIREGDRYQIILRIACVIGYLITFIVIGNVNVIIVIEVQPKDVIGRIETISIQLLSHIF